MRNFSEDGGLTAADASLRPILGLPSPRARLSAVAVALLTSCLMTACGGAQTHRLATRHTGRSRAARAGERATHAAPVALAYRPLYQLPAPVQDPASAGLGGTRFVLLGGLTAADTSSDQVIVGTGTSASVRAVLPNAQHDAQAAPLAGQVYLFGGGQFTQYDHILAFDPSSDHVSMAGSLPTAASDVAVAGGPSTAYVVGGFDGVHWLNTVLAYTPHHPVHVLAHLPVALRYAAAAVIGHELLVAGGSTPTGASRTVYRVDLKTGSVRALGQLPTPLTHAGAGSLEGEMYLVGGRGAVVTARSSAVYGINPVTGRVHLVGHLPSPLSDEAVVSASGHLLVAGGAGAGGTQAAVGELVPSG